MSSQISLKVGNVTATVTIGAGITDQQVGAALARFAESLGIPIDGTNQENLTAICNHFIDVVKRRSKEVQVNAARAANEASIQATANSDNAL